MNVEELIDNLPARLKDSQRQTVPDFIRKYPNVISSSVSDFGKNTWRRLPPLYIIARKLNDIIAA